VCGVPLETSPLARQVIGAAIEVHRHLGPGLLESTYRTCLARELASRGVEALVEVPLPVHYKGLDTNSMYRVDLLVEGTLVVEAKAVERILPVHLAQLRTYLRLLSLRQGLLMNFNVSLLRHGIRSVLNHGGSFQGP
jgi:GxxExxY protein